MNGNRWFRILRRTRIVLAGMVMIVLLLMFIAPANPTSPLGHWLADIQLIPALLKISAPQLLMYGLLSMLPAVLLTLLCGRIYCSILCPFGILQDILHRLLTLPFRRFQRFRPQSPHRIWRGATLLVAALCLASGIVLPLLLLDPYAWFGRIAVALFNPPLIKLNNLLAGLSGSGLFSWLYPRELPSLNTLSIVIAAAAFAAIAVLAALRGRLFCNTVCPVGALLGLLSRISLFRLAVGTSCGSCGKCAGRCKTGCIDPQTKTIDFERCVMCLNCGESCRFDAVRFVLRGHRTADADADTAANPAKREFLLAAGAAATTMLVAAPLRPQLRHLPVMPPGARSLVHFQSKCIACHQCVTVCPTRVIRPAGLEYGAGGMMQPLLDFKRNMCEFDCTRCSNICPTGALQPLSRELKRQTRIGKVEYRPQYCIVPNRKTDCGACAEHCPTQAVRMVPWQNGLNIPATDISICVGCGSCEHICPVTPKAIVVNGVSVQDMAKKPSPAPTARNGGNDFPF